VVAAGTNGEVVTIRKRSAASVTVRLRGGPFDGQSAVSYGAVVGSLIDVNQKTYRVTNIEPVPGRREETGIATYEPRPGTPGGRPLRKPSL
jgi:hypothetical protein